MADKQEHPFELSPAVMEIAHNITLACLLESAVPKPGNVSPIHAFHSTRYEHYLSGSVAVGLTLGKLARRGREPTLGKIVHEAVANVSRKQSGGNTHLGIILLLAPLVRAAGSDHGSIQELRSELHDVLNALDYRDTQWYFKAINLASPGGLLDVPELDVREPSTLKLITERKISVKNWMKVSIETNSVSFEYNTDYQLTFESGLQYLNSMMNSDKKPSIPDMVLRLYLKFLAERPDSLVLGKFDIKTAEYVQSEGNRLLAMFENGDSHAQAQTDKFNAVLNAKQINPGMSADLTASTLFVALTMGLKI